MVRESGTSGSRYFYIEFLKTINDYEKAKFVYALIATAWTQHTIYNMGPDVSFRNIQLNSSGVPHDCFISGELWNKRAALYCIVIGAVNGWNDPANVPYSQFFT